MRTRSISLHYRALSEADAERCLALERYAFAVNPDPALLDTAKLAQFRGLFAGETLAAQLEILPLRVQLGFAAEAPLAGIGSVAGTPELRRRGYVATLLRHSVDELRAAGVSLCMLYPFKQSFYARYGWATCMERRAYSGPPAHFRSFQAAPGAWVRAGVDDVAELDRIHRTALRGRCCVLARDPAWWREHVLFDWQRRPRHAYLWRDQAGQGRAYAIFRFEGEGSARKLICREMVASDALARAQLFAFIAGHEDQIAEVSFRAPADAPVNLLFPNPLRCELEPYFMLRLLDVPTALEAYPFPRELTGRLSFALSDDWLESNQGCFALELEAGRARVTRLPPDAAVGLRLDVRVLTQLYSRLLRPRSAAAFGLLAAPDRAALELAEQAFAGLAPFSTDMF